MNAPLPHVELLARIVRRRFEETEAFLRRPGLDLSSFGEFVEYHRVAGLVSLLLEEGGLGDAFPEEFRARCKHFYLRQWTKNERLVREAARLLPRLTEAAPSLLFLKGPFLAQRFYGNIDRRAVSDLDVLVRGAAEVERVERVLLAEGYERASLVPLSRRLAYAFAHHFNYRRGDLAVEVHWALQRHVSYRIDHDAIRARSEDVNVGGREFRVPCALDEIVLQILSAFTDAQVGDFRLKSLVDLHAILACVEPSTDWAAFFTARRAEGLYRASATVLAMLLDVLDCAAEFPSLAAELRRHPEAVLVDGREAALALLGASRYGLRDKLRLLRLYDAPLPLSAAWWAISLPVRLVVYREETVRRRKF